MLSLSAALEQEHLPALDSECQIPNRIQYNGTGALVHVEDMEAFAALDCHPTLQPVRDPSL